MKRRSGGATPRETVDLLREVYVECLRDGRAEVSKVTKAGPSPGLTKKALVRAAETRLVKVEESGLVELTPEGRGKLTVVMLGGAFEIIHPGHINALTEAKATGNTLVVVVATDKSVERNKGRPPVTTQALRVGLVSSLRQVDLALPGNRGSIFDILVKVRPDVVALGYDQSHNAQEIVKEAAKRGVETRTVRLGAPTPHVKTSKILSSM